MIYRLDLDNGRKIKELTVQHSIDMAALWWGFWFHLVASTIGEDWYGPPISPIPLQLGQPLSLICHYKWMKTPKYEIQRIGKIGEIQIAMLSGLNDYRVPKYYVGMFPNEEPEGRVRYNGIRTNVSISYKGFQPTTGTSGPLRDIQNTSLQVVFEKTFCNMVGVVEFRYDIVEPPNGFRRHDFHRYVYLDKHKHLPKITLVPNKRGPSYGYWQEMSCEVTSSTNLTDIEFKFKSPYSTDNQFHRTLSGHLVSLPHVPSWPELPQNVTLSQRVDDQCLNQIIYTRKVKLHFVMTNSAILNTLIRCVATLRKQGYAANGMLVEAKERFYREIKIGNCTGGACLGPEFGSTAQEDYGDAVGIYGGPINRKGQIILVRRVKEKETKGIESKGIAQFFTGLVILAGMLLVVGAPYVIRRRKSVPTPDLETIPEETLSKTTLAETRKDEESETVYT